YRHPLGFGCSPEFAIDTSRSLPSVFRHTPHSQCLGRQRAGQHPLQGFHLAPVAFPRCLRNTYLHSSDVSFHAVPVELVPGGDNAEGRRRAAINALSHAILLSGLTGEGTSALAGAEPNGPISCLCE